MNLAGTRITVIFFPLLEVDFVFTEMYPNNSTVVRFPQEFQFPGFYGMQVSILTDITQTFVCEIFIDT